MRSGERGYAALLALLTVALASAAIFVAISAQNAQRAAVRRAASAMTLDRASASAQGRLGFLLLTQPMGLRGPIVGADRAATRQNPNSQTAAGLRSGAGQTVEEIVLDGRFYAFTESTGLLINLQAQDSAGSVNINDSDSAALARFIALRGGSRSEANALADAAADFADTDNTRRAFGAEKADYEAFSMPAPRDRVLTSTHQLSGIIGWAQTIERRSDVLTALSVRSGDSGFNPNTATATALRAALNINARAAQNVIESREQEPFQSAEDFSARSGLAGIMAPVPITTRPNGDVTVKVTLPQSPQRAAAFRLRTMFENAERPLLLEPVLPRDVFLMETAYVGVRPLPGGDYTYSK